VVIILISAPFFYPEEIMKNPLIMIGIPSTSDWKADFAMSMLGLVASAQQPLANGGKIGMLRFHNAKGSILPKSRELLAETAIREGATHLLFVDSDMTFPPFTLHQLLRHEKSVVAANCVTKVLPALPTARQFKIGVPAGELVDSRERRGLSKVWRVGTGVMLVETAVLKQLPKPWFPITWNPDNNDYVGEDWNFCRACEEAGIDIWIDNELSKHIGHIGAYTFTQTDQGD
jgi:hypothetical protein